LQKLCWYIFFHILLHNALHGFAGESLATLALLDIVRETNEGYAKRNLAGQSQRTALLGGACQCHNRRIKWANDSNLSSYLLVYLTYVLVASRLMLRRVDRIARLTLRHRKRRTKRTATGAPRIKPSSVDVVDYVVRSCRRRNQATGVRLGICLFATDALSTSASPSSAWRSRDGKPYVRWPASSMASLVGPCFGKALSTCRLCSLCERATDAWRTYAFAETGRLCSLSNVRLCRDWSTLPCDRA